MNHRTKILTINIMLFALLFFTCQFTLKGVGAGSSERNAVYFSIFIILMSGRKGSFWFIAFPLFFIMAIYTPIGLMFSLPTYQSISSILSTNILETREFLSQASIYNIIYPLLLISGMLLFRFFYIKTKSQLHMNKLILVLFLTYSFLLSNSSIFYQDIVESINKVRATNFEIKNYKNTWGQSNSINGGYDRYVIVIGESARSDYINAFGYKLDNSPFMSSHGTSIKGLISGGSNTVASLSRMLTKTNNNEPNYDKNIIGLANGAGIKTYWISNQGFISDCDTPISLIANQSTKKYFLKYGAFNSENTSDFMLLEKTREIIDKNNKNKELIVVHLYGSHPKPCKRVIDYDGSFKSNDNKKENVVCYVNSIQKTDEFLKELNEQLYQSWKKNNITYSMLYFSDHGMVHEESGNKINMIHGESKHSYEIPLFKIDYNDSKRTYCESRKNGLNFIDGIANWMNIKNSNIPEEYNLFDCKNDDSKNLSYENAKRNQSNDIDAITDGITNKTNH